MKTLNKYVTLIRSRKFTERDLIAFRKYVNGSSPLSAEDAHNLIETFNHKAETAGILLTEEQQAKGIDWLRRSTFRLNGAVRKSAPLAYFEQQVVKGYKRFTCVGLYDLNPGRYRQYVPIYRCHDKQGRYFDYACMMWGEIKVLEIGDRHGSISRCNQPEWETARKGFQLIRGEVA